MQQATNGTNVYTELQVKSQKKYVLDFNSKEILIYGTSRKVFHLWAMLSCTVSAAYVASIVALYPYGYGHG